MTTERSSRNRSRYVALVILVTLIAVAGYLGYVLFPRFGLPPVEGVALLGLAAGAGVAAFFSPCSFPLLLAMLGGQRSVRGSTTSRSPVLFGAAVALGAALFLLIVGAVIAVGGAALFSGITFASPAGISVRTVVGVLLILLGLAQIGIVDIPLHSVSRLMRPLVGGHPAAPGTPPLSSHVMFGFGYVLAGFG